MNHRLYWIGTVALVCSGYAHAKETTVSTVQIALKTMGTHSTYRVTLPFAVYANLAHADLADLRVINADDEPVPFAFVDLPNPAVVETLGVIVPFFPLPITAGTDLQGIDLTVRQNTDGTVLELHSAPPSMTFPPATRSYLLDASKISQSYDHFSFEWTQGPNPVPYQITI